MFSRFLRFLTLLLVCMSASVANGAHHFGFARIRTIFHSQIEAAAASMNEWWYSSLTISTGPQSLYGHVAVAAFYANSSTKMPVTCCSEYRRRCVR